MNDDQRQLIDELSIGQWRKGFICPMCGRNWPHQHSPEEVTIFGNGRKYERKQSALTTTRPQKLNEMTIDEMVIALADETPAYDEEGFCLNPDADELVCCIRAALTTQAPAEPAAHQLSAIRLQALADSWSRLPAEGIWSHLTIDRDGTCDTLRRAARALAVQPPATLDRMIAALEAIGWKNSPTEKGLHQFGTVNWLDYATLETLAAPAPVEPADPLDTPLPCDVTVGKEMSGYAVLSRQEWHDKLDEAARDGYAEGRKDERELFSELVVALTEKRRANRNIVVDADACFAATDRVWAAYDAIVAEKSLPTSTATGSTRSSQLGSPEGSAGSADSDHAKGGQPVKRWPYCKD